MERQEIESKVIEILVDKLGIDQESVKMESKLEDDFGADFLDCVEIIMELEHEFPIRIPDEDAESVETVKDIVDLVERHV